MICKNCGAQFEGPYCPECGVTAEEPKHFCANCGSELENGAAFCPKCGTAVGASQPQQPQQQAQEPQVFQPYQQPYAQQAAPEDSKTKTMRQVYRWVPVGLFGLLSVLMLAFFAAPVASVWGGSVSFYDTLQALGDSGVDAGWFITIYSIIFVPMGLLQLLIYGISLLVGAKRFLKQYEATMIVWEILYLIMGIGLAAYWGSQEIEEFSVSVSVGAGPILIIVFSALFLAAQITLYIFKKKFDKKHPQTNGLMY